MISDEPQEIGFIRFILLGRIRTPHEWFFSTNLLSNLQNDTKPVGGRRIYTTFALIIVKSFKQYASSYLINKISTTEQSQGSKGPIIKLRN